MVKGITKRVVVVKPPDDDIFDEAIFLVREDAFEGGVTSADILRQAKGCANDFMMKNAAPKTKCTVNISALVHFLLGAVSVSLIWLLSFFI